MNTNSLFSIRRLLLASLAVFGLSSMQVAVAREPYVLAFQRANGGTQEIGLVDENGANLTVLTEGALHYSEHAWSEDRQKIAFMLEREVWSIQPDSKEIRKVTQFGQHTIFCDWSHDGRRILCKTGKNDGYWSLCEVAVDTGEVRVIADSQPGHPCHWSPTAETIVTYGHRAEYELTADGEKVYVARAHSRDMQHHITVRTKTGCSSTAYISHTLGRQEHKLAEMPGMYLSDFTFSPDGQTIAFVARRMPVADGEGAPGELDDVPDSGIYVINVSSANLACVVKDGFRPVWRPCVTENNRVMFLQMRHHGGKSGFNVLINPWTSYVQYHAYMTKDAEFTVRTEPDVWTRALSAIASHDYDDGHSDHSAVSLVIHESDGSRRTGHFSWKDDVPRGSVLRKIYKGLLDQARDN